MIDRSTLMQETGAAFLRVAPPVGVSIATALKALDPQWVIAIPTVLFIALQGAYLLWKWRREARAKANGAS